MSYLSIFRRNSRLFSSIIFSVLLLASPINAEDKSEVKSPEKTVELGQSIISPDYIEIEKLKSTKNVIVIDKKDIEEKGYPTLSEVLDDVPGITVGVSGWGEIDIRGQGEGEAAKNIQVLVDGAPITLLLNHPYTANYDIIPVEQIEKIEVIPGGGSVLYGAGTAGGVVNITTNLKSMVKPVNKVGYEFTHDNERKYYANVGGKVTDNLTLQANYSHSNKDWYFVDTFDDTDYFSGGLNYKINDNQAIAFKYSRFKEDGKFLKTVSLNDTYYAKGLDSLGKDFRPKPGVITIGVDENGQKIKKEVDGYLVADRLEEEFKGTYSANLFKNTQLIFDVFHRDGEFKNNKYEGDDDQKIEQETSGGKAKFNIDYGQKNSIIFGVDYYKQTANISYDDVRSKSTRYGDKPDTAAGEYATSYGTIKNKEGKTIYVADPLIFDYDKQTKAVYFLNIFKHKELEFTLGARYDRTDWEVYKDQAGGWGVIGDSSSRHNMNYEASVGWNYRDTGKIYGRYERGFTSPNGMEITDRVYIGDKKATVLTDADDQKFDMYEVGIRDYILGSAINLTTFYSSTDNQLDRFYDMSSGHFETKTMNLLETYRYGMEFTAQQQFGNFTFEEGYTYLMGETKYNKLGKEKEGDVKFTNDGLKKVPRDNMTLKADYEFTDNLAAGITWKYTGSYNNFMEEEDKSSDKIVQSNTVTDFSFRYNHPNGINFYGGINNLFDEEYFGYVSGGGSYTYVVPQNGRTYFVGLSYTF